MGQPRIWALVCMAGLAVSMGVAVGNYAPVAYGAAESSTATTGLTTGGVLGVIVTAIGGVVSVLKSGALGQHAKNIANTAIKIEQTAEEAAMQLLIGSAGVRGDADIGGDLAAVSAKIKSRWWGGEAVVPDIAPSTLKDLLKLDLIDDHLLSVIKSIRSFVKPETKK